MSWDVTTLPVAAGPIKGFMRRRRMAPVHVDRGEHGSLIRDDWLWRRWLRAFALAYDAPDRPPASACPGCGRVGLRLEFTGADDLLGFASVWCPVCLTGISTCRTAIPADVPRLPWTMPVHERAAIIPGYVFVLPCYDESAWRRWSRNIATGLGLCMGPILVVGVVLAVLGLPAAASFLLRRTLPVVFAAYGTVSAVAVFARWRERRDVDPGERSQTP